MLREQCNFSKYKYDDDDEHLKVWFFKWNSSWHVKFFETKQKAFIPFFVLWLEIFEIKINSTIEDESFLFFSPFVRDPEEKKNFVNKTIRSH